MTIRTLNSAYQNRIGQRTRMSEIDKNQINKMYSCSAGSIGGGGGSGGGGGGGGSGGCVDLNSKCPGWKSYCNNPRNKNWMAANCKKTCGLCSGGGGGSGSCKDAHAQGSTQCGKWLKYCSDSRYRDFMKKNCA